MTALPILLRKFAPVVTTSSIELALTNASRIRIVSPSDSTVKNASLQARALDESSEHYFSTIITHIIPNVRS